MVVLQTKNNHIFEIDNTMLEETKEFLKKLSKKKHTKFSYIDELGDTIAVLDGKEYVVPTAEDVTLFHTIDKNDLISEEEAKKLLDV
jgi:hypothetical protein